MSILVCSFCIVCCLFMALANAYCVCKKRETRNLPLCQKQILPSDCLGRGLISVIQLSSIVVTTTLISDLAHPYTRLVWISFDRFSQSFHNIAWCEKFGSRRLVMSCIMVLCPILGINACSWPPVETLLLCFSI